jgi:ribosome modulation factor
VTFSPVGRDRTKAAWRQTGFQDYVARRPKQDLPGGSTARKWYLDGWRAAEKQAAAAVDSVQARA